MALRALLLRKKIQEQKKLLDEKRNEENRSKRGLGNWNVRSKRSMITHLKKTKNRWKTRLNSWKKIKKLWRPLKVD